MDPIHENCTAHSGLTGRLNVVIGLLIFTLISSGASMKLVYDTKQEMITANNQLAVKLQKVSSTVDKHAEDIQRLEREVLALRGL